MEISRKTKVTYSLSEKEISRIVLKSMRLQEEHVDSIVFVVDSAGSLAPTELAMNITMSFEDDVEGPQD